MKFPAFFSASRQIPPVQDRHACPGNTMTGDSFIASGAETEERPRLQYHKPRSGLRSRRVQESRSNPARSWARLGLWSLPNWLSAAPIKQPPALSESPSRQDFVGSRRVGH